MRTALRAPTIVIPSRDHLVMDCGGCGGREFAAHVRAEGSRGRLVELVCTRCKKVFRIADDAFVEGDGKTTIHNRAGRRQ